MTMRDVELGAYNDSIRLETAQLVEALRSILGAQLVAYLASVGETRAVRQWAEGTRQPRPDVFKRLQTSYHVAAFLEKHESRATVQAWFQGLNPQLDDQSPARLLREGTLDSVGKQVLAAARNFAGTA